MSPPPSCSSHRLCHDVSIPQDELRRRAEAERREAERTRQQQDREREKELEMIRKQYLVGVWIRLGGRDRQRDARGGRVFGEGGGDVVKPLGC